MERLGLFYQVFAQQAERAVGKYRHPTDQRRPSLAYAKEVNCLSAIGIDKTPCLLFSNRFKVFIRTDLLYDDPL
jgi:hypothetical protein